MLRERWHLWPACGLPRTPGLADGSVRHGFIREGHRDVFHCDAVHNGGERVQVVGVGRISCEQVICTEKQGGCYLGGEGGVEIQDRD